MKRKLFAYLRNNGWSVKKINDIHFCRKGNDVHKLVLVDENFGAEIVSDWSFYENDRDGFNALINKFLDDNDKEK